MHLNPKNGSIELHLRWWLATSKLKGKPSNNHGLLCSTLSLSACTSKLITKRLTDISIIVNGFKVFQIFTMVFHITSLLIDRPANNFPTRHCYPLLFPTNSFSSSIVILESSSTESFRFLHRSSKLSIPQSIEWIRVLRPTALRTRTPLHLNHTKITTLVLTLHFYP